jgi:hypothetical protein
LTDLPATNESWLSLSTCGWPSTPIWTNPVSPTPFCLGAGMPRAAHKTLVAGLLGAWISIPHVTFPLLFWKWIDFEMGAAVAVGASAATPTATVETARAANRFMLSPRARLPRLLQAGLAEPYNGYPNSIERNRFRARRRILLSALGQNFEEGRRRCICVLLGSWPIRESLRRERSPARGRCGAAGVRSLAVLGRNRIVARHVCFEAELRPARANASAACQEQTPRPGCSFSINSTLGRPPSELPQFVQTDSAVSGSRDSRVDAETRVRQARQRKQ